MWEILRGELLVPQNKQVYLNNVMNLDNALLLILVWLSVNNYDINLLLEPLGSDIDGTM